MNKKQRLYPQLIYRINTILSEIRDSLESQNFIEPIAPSVFDPYRRVFHWITVDQEKNRWKLDKQALENINEMIDNYPTEWDKFKSEFKYENRFILRAVEDAFVTIESSKNIEDINFALLLLHQFSLVNPEKYIDGILRRNLIRRAKNNDMQHQIDYATAELLSNKDKTYVLYPWAKMQFFLGDDGERKISCQENNSAKKSYPPSDKADIDESEMNVIPELESEEWYIKNEYYVERCGVKCTPATIGKNHFHKNYFVPYFFGYKDFTLSKFLELFPKHFIRSHHLLIIPLYDVCIGQKYYGNLCGTLQIPFEDEKKLCKFKIKHKDNLIKSSSLIVQQIKESATHEILKQPIEEACDFLEHFIKYITLLQDWERIMVWKKGVVDPIYCYEHYKRVSEEGKTRWEICRKKNNCVGCEESILKDLRSHLNSRSDPYCNKKNIFILRMEDILDYKILPSLEDEIIARYENYTLCFEFPAYTVFPTDNCSSTKGDKKNKEGAIKKLGEHYVNKLIPIFDRLLLKRKVLKHSVKSAVSAIMSRNLSHNIGSHVLSAVKEDYIKNNAKQVDEFNSYLQRRMDLLARFVGDRPNWGEPMLFVRDLLNDFFNQSLLLNNIIADQGRWSEKKIEFHICLPAGEHHVFKYVATEKKWICQNQIEDFLVSIPDGLIGAQAFYIFLESMIRNSAKYGTAKSDKFVVMIDVEEKDEYYKLTIRDNFSLCNGDLVSSIQDKIRETIVDSEGVLSTKSLGIAEMREVCGFLVQPYGEDYPAFKDTDSKIYPLWAECPTTADCPKVTDETSLPCSIPCEYNHLSYTFNLAKPKMVGLVNYNSHLRGKAQRYGIERIDKERLLTKKGSFQFVVIYDINKDIFEFLSKNKHALPQRILLVNRDNSNFQNNHLKQRTVSCQSGEICINKTPEELILSVYEAWIRNKWLKNDCVHLYITSDRDEEDAFFTNWKKQIKRTQVLADKMCLSLLKTFKHRSGTPNCIEERAIKEIADCASCKCVLYDGHKRLSNSNAFAEKQKYFVHNIGSENKKIFETMAFPPKDDFAFDFFLLGLIEAASTKVVIVDERVADNSITVNNSINCFHLKSLNECLCYPMFFIDKKNETGITDKIKDKFPKEVKTQCCIQGVDVEKVDVETMQEKGDADFIIIHYGLIETHSTELGHIDSLYEIAPSVIVTTGRGAGTIKDDSFKRLPFLEFSALRHNCYPTISKYHLVRALMSTKGGVIKSA